MISMVSVVTAYSPDGAIDATWGNAGSIELPDIVTQLSSSGRSLATDDVGYLLSPFSPIRTTRVGRIDSTNGAVVEHDPLDGVWEPAGLLPDKGWVLDVAHHPSGATSTLMTVEDDLGLRIGTEPNPRQRIMVTRRDSQGDLDAAFGTGGALLIDRLNPGVLYGPTRLAADGEQLLVLMVDLDDQSLAESTHHLARLSETGEQLELGPDRFTVSELDSSPTGQVSLHLVEPDTPTGGALVLRVSKQETAARVEANTPAGGLIGFATNIVGFPITDHGRAETGLSSVSATLGLKTLFGGPGVTVDTAGPDIVITSAWSDQTTGRTIGWSMRYQARAGSAGAETKLVPLSLAGPNKPQIWRDESTSFSLAETRLDEDNTLQVLTLEDDTQRTPQWRTYGPIFNPIGNPVDLAASPAPAGGFLVNYGINCCLAGPDRALVSRPYYVP